MDLGLFQVLSAGITGCQLRLRNPRPRVASPDLLSSRWSNMPPARVLPTRRCIPGIRYDPIPSAIERANRISDDFSARLPWNPSGETRPESDATDLGENAVNHLSDIRMEHGVVKMEDGEDGADRASTHLVKMEPDEDGGDRSSTQSDPRELCTSVDACLNEGQTGTDEGIVSPGYSDPAPGMPPDICYSTLRRLITKASLWEYLAFAGMDEDQMDVVMPILKKQYVTNWDIFIFREYISLARLLEWGIPYTFAVRLVIHGEMFYHYMLLKNL
ncbi:uncharacterized protein MELLADRAFT_70227 [Melampsora larici-populina 98AG31]|uniref:Uncharacterized protein n=1 Tax=Melampsora larici-populina (strain 98AG31 / pathotype 3-4-7) TaxID=747676 RepID=F4SE43_MELLP|nr:uncharacterized protein MELLADRAFT_70227 [Melampsora larici-populina 98AG31]EGF97084.1 hypothetical protein MELLADRAFT_70227 [Melampsora larici-populina 98AG31]